MGPPRAPDALGRCVGDAGAFLTATFGVAPHLWHGARPFDDVLSLGDVDHALTGSGLRRPAIRVVRDGEVVAPGAYTRRARTGATTIDDLVDTGRVLDLFAGGATLVLQGLHRWWAPAAHLCRDLETALGHAVQANAYLTPPGAAGLAPHHDTHDVFVLQVAGTKHWVVREPVIDAPLPRHASDHGRAAAQPVLFETDLAPGDALYLPRGHVHSATAQRGVSLHLTVGILATTLHDLLRHVVDAAGDDPALRRSLAPGWAFDDGVATAEVAAAVAGLAGWLDRVDAAGIAAGMRADFVARRTPLLDGQLLELVGLDSIGDGSVVTRRAGTIVAITHEGPAGDAPPDGRGALRVTLGDRRLAMPAVLEPAVRLLTDGEPHRVAELAGMLDAPSRRVLVRRLVREGALRAGGTTGRG